MRSNKRSECRREVKVPKVQGGAEVIADFYLLIHMCTHPLVREKELLPRVTLLYYFVAFTSRGALYLYIS